MYAPFTPRPFDVVLPDALGHPALGFRDGRWFRVGSDQQPPHPVAARAAILGNPHAAGPIVQIMCWWMRENPRHGHAVDLATELALLVGEMSRELSREMSRGGTRGTPVRELRAPRPALPARSGRY
ncbi:hypothetical protein [Yinghuangia sp. YIM S09857]|uniref:hypothetical protein n=1 Tax=Yinghuangia sp. YIM S09857 TaxID=3436929 RepID=UPI003F52C6AD